MESESTINRRQALAAASVTAAMMVFGGKAGGQDAAGLKPVTRAFITGKEHGFVALT
jgi:hypothetical protein